MLALAVLVVAVAQENPVVVEKGVRAIDRGTSGPSETQIHYHPNKTLVEATRAPRSSSFPRPTPPAAFAPHYFAAPSSLHSAQPF